MTTIPPDTRFCSKCESPLPRDQGTEECSRCLHDPPATPNQANDRFHTAPQTRELRDVEARVIESAVDWHDAQHALQYCPAQEMVSKAERDLLQAVAELHAEDDGRWRGAEAVPWAQKASLCECAHCGYSGTVTHYPDDYVEHCPRCGRNGNGAAPQAQQSVEPLSIVQAVLEIAYVHWLQHGTPIKTGDAPLVMRDALSKIQEGAG